ncbi:N-acetylmuramoyl-L-alanine amidase [Pseudoprevotella muciniphila]|uniref:N-acetylmuramoyl-L-alanine amidase n=1 Tax=Pseudoprevotella muciniphila TaxID=2133944 RepID=A0A5P8E7X4_9BACT|nr:N-acetylmuramoyl-L-alanine amidase [Pseudoprevotella muciniphila]QFQ13073.1 N-acetylmuramoyl-L-alanine amidase [Pseudoprevotella muciniphila]
MSKVVILGTAHGSNVAGKCSPDGRFREYRFSREIISMLKPRLESLGLTVFVDMPQDVVPLPMSTELSQRCKIVNGICGKYGKENCVYVSIHVNAAGGDGKWHDARGFAVYVSRSCSSSSKRLAKLLCDLALVRGLRGNRSVPGEHYWQAGFYVLKHTVCPAVLSENLFQDNRADVEFLMSPSGKEAVAALHLDALKQYFGINQ